MKDIFTFLEKQKIPIEETNPKIKTSIDYFDCFMKKYPLDELSSLINLDYTQYLIFFLSLISPQNQDIISQIITKYEKQIKKLNFEQLASLLIVFASTRFQEINQNLTFFKVFKVSDVFDLICLEEKVNLFIISNALLKLHFNMNFIVDIASLFKNLGVTPLQMKDFQTNLIHIEAVIQFVNNHQFNNRLKKAVDKSKGDPELRKIFQIHYGEVGMIKSGYNKQVNEAIKHNSQIDKLVNTLRSYPDYIPGRVINKIVKIPVDEYIINEALDYIASVNSLAEQSALEEMQEVQSNTDLIIDRILSSYDIKVGNLKEEKEFLKTFATEDLEIILDFLAKYQIPFTKIYDIDKYDVKKIQILNDLVEKGIPLVSFIKRHINLAYKNDNSLAMVTSNINILYANDINIINYPHNVEILLSPIANLSLFSLMGFKIDKQTTDIGFLTDPDLYRKMFLLIDGNLISFLQGFGILNLSYEEIYFKVICHKLDIPDDNSLFKHTNILTLIPEVNLLVPEEIRKSLEENIGARPIPEILTPFQTSDGILCINGIYISSYRVMSNLGALDDINNPNNIFYAIIFNSIYTLEEVNLIKEGLKEVGLEIQTRN